MDEKEYNTLCDELFEALETYLAAHEGDFDYDNYGEICEVSFDGGRKIVVSRQPPLREIWLADRSGGFHFRHEAGEWVDTKGGKPLMQRLEDCIRQNLAQ